MWWSSCLLSVIFKPVSAILHKINYAGSSKKDQLEQLTIFSVHCGHQQVAKLPPKQRLALLAELFLFVSRHEKMIAVSHNRMTLL